MKDEGNVFGVDETPSRKPRLVAFIVVFLLLLVALGFAINYFVNNKKVLPKLSISPTVTQAPTETPTSTPSATPSATGNPTPTSKLSPTVSKTSITPTKSANSPEAGITVEVLNGSGVSGVAGTMATSLKNLGYTVTSTGNADSFSYTNVVIEVKKSEPTTLTLLKSDLSKDYTIGSASATLTDSNTTDAIVIVGK